MYGSFSKLCGGNVRVSRIVKLQTDDTVVEAGAGDEPWGISQPSTHTMALSGVISTDDGFAGIVGSPPINIYGPGDDECPLVLAGTVAVGDKIKATTGGAGITAGSDGDKVIAIAHKIGGVSGDVIPVKPMRFDRGS
jgi:hypothetical protein